MFKRASAGPLDNTARYCFADTNTPRSPKKNTRQFSPVIALLSSSVIVTGSLLLASDAALAACSSSAPTSGQTVTCDSSAPNPTSSAVTAAPGSSNVTVNIQSGSALTITRATSVTGVNVGDGSTINNDGNVSLSGGGGSGLNRGAGLLGLGNNNVFTNGASGIVSTTGAFNDGMAANGSGNTLINNGSITTTGPNAYGMTASWGQSGGGQPNNTLINSGTVTTSGSNARAASILGQSGLINNSGTLQTSGTSSTGAYMQGTNDQLINSGTIHASGAGSEGVFSNTAGSSFTATIINLFGGQIISDQGPAIRTLNGATTITNAGLLSGGNGTALGGGNGNITFVLQTGSQIIGLANGGAGNNVVRLQGTGTVSNPFANFQTLYMEGSAWTWSGSGDFHDTFVNSGALQLQSSLTGNVNIAAGTGLLVGNSANPSITPYPGGPAITVTNAGLIDLTNGSSPATNSLTIAGNYVGNGGQLNVRSVLGADNSPSDKLVISGGAASGTTSIGVTNTGGSGGLTVNDGILVVQTTNGATTTTNAFALNGGMVMAGAYQYYLFHGGITAGTSNNWYLRSSVPPASVTGTTPPPTPAPDTPILPPAPVGGTAPVPLYRPEAALYSAVPAMARQLGITTLSNFHDRQGDQTLLTGGNGIASGAWGRVFGEHTSQQWSGMTNPSFSGTLNGLQSGLDLFGWDNDGHRDRVGFFAAYGRAYGDVRGFSRGFQNVPVGTLSVDATSVGGYWTHIGPGGWYVDGVVMNSWYTGSPSSIGGLSAATSGTGFAASLEGGYPFALTSGLSLEPQAQLIYQHLSFAATQDQVSSVSYGGADALSGRIGLRLQGNYQDTMALLQPYFKANLWQDFGGRDTVTFAGADILDTRRLATAFEFGGGVVAKFSSAVGIFAGASYTTNLSGNDRQTIQGNAGIRVTW